MRSEAALDNAIVYKEIECASIQVLVYTIKPKNSPHLSSFVVLETPVCTSVIFEDNQKSVMPPCHLLLTGTMTLH